MSSNAAGCSYIICTQPRSGSWLLAEALESTRLAGRPREYYNPITEKKLREQWSASAPEDYLERVLKMATTANGVFGIKIHWNQLHPMVEKLRQIPRLKGLALGEVLQQALCSKGKGLAYIWLSRKDRIRQAISHYRAANTGQWWQIENQNDGPRQENGPADPAWDFAAVRRFEKMAHSQDIEWERFFQSIHVTPRKIYYEDLAESYETTVVGLMREFGIAVPGGEVVRPTRLRRQSDSLTEEWVAKYHECAKSSGIAPTLIPTF